METTTGITVIDYTERSFVLAGNTKPYKDKLGKLGLNGRYNPRLTHPVTKEIFKGWIFSMKRKQSVLESLRTFTEIIEGAANEAPLEIIIFPQWRKNN